MSYSSSTYSQNDALDDEVQELARAISNLPTTPRRPAYDHSLVWIWQIKAYLPFFSNAEKILSQVEIPRHISKKRLTQFVNSTSITPDGHAFPPQITEILRGRLYLADEYSGTDKGELIGLGITHVVCIGLDDYHDQACPNVPGIEHAVLEVPDEDTIYDVPLVGIVDNALSFLRKVLWMNSANKVLIHCLRGDNWGAGMAIGIVMDLYGFTFESGLDFILALRRNVNLHVMVTRAVQQWWTLEKLRPDLPKGRGYRPFKWAEEKQE